MPATSTMRCDVSSSPRQPDFARRSAVDDFAEVKQNAPTLDVALDEQLGLKLVRSSAPLEVLVIDSVAMPTPN